MNLRVDILREGLLSNDDCADQVFLLEGGVVLVLGDFSSANSKGKLASLSKRLGVSLGLDNKRSTLRNRFILSHGLEFVGVAEKDPEDMELEEDSDNKQDDESPVVSVTSTR